MCYSKKNEKYIKILETFAKYVIFIYKEIFEILVKITGPTGKCSDAS